MPAATAAGTRPRSSRGGSSRAHLAYDLGRKGEPAPAWLADDPKLAHEYDRGVDDRDAAAAGAKPRERTPDPTDADTHAREATPASDSDPAPPRSARSLLPSIGFSSSGGDVVDSVSSALLGAIGYALLINYVRGGTAGVRQWVWAKFTNGDGTLP